MRGRNVRREGRHEGGRRENREKQKEKRRERERERWVSPREQPVQLSRGGADLKSLLNNAPIINLQDLLPINQLAEASAQNRHGKSYALENACSISWPLSLPPSPRPPHGQQGSKFTRSREERAHGAAIDPLAQVLVASRRRFRLCPLSPSPHSLSSQARWLP